jgi:N-acetyl-1-D-myo-inositol-2-amino-2-deoxy-alpha-D-glucopyranoside deacetylase
MGGGIVTGILMLVVGAVSGAVLTLVHQATVPIAGTVVPWGAIVALAITAALLAGLRIVSPTRIPALGAALGLLVTNALLALPTAGGSVLVQANLAGYAWTFGPVLIAVVVLGWPRLPARRENRMDVENPKGADPL